LKHEICIKILIKNPVKATKKNEKKILIEKIVGGCNLMKKIKIISNKININ
jgi:hypothetical protein